MATSSMTTYSNNTISQVEINGTTYDITDATTRSTVSQLDSRVSTLEDSVAYSTGGITFTPASGITVNSYGSRHLGRVHFFTLDCTSSTARAAGQLTVGSITGNIGNLSALGVARVTAAGGLRAYEGISQIAPASGSSHDVRVFSSVENSNAYYLQMMWIA